MLNPPGRERELDIRYLFKNQNPKLELRVTDTAQLSTNSFSKSYGDGLDTTVVFRPRNGVIFLKNTNDTGFADIALNYGLPGDQPVVGDWDDNGAATIGIYRNGSFYLRNSNTNGFAEIVFGLGNPSDMPIAGDWHGVP